MLCGGAGPGAGLGKDQTDGGHLEECLATADARSLPSTFSILKVDSRPKTCHHHVLTSKVALDMSEVTQNFRNMSLSLRGAERQPPTLLQMALRFSRVMELLNQSGNTESRLNAAIESFNKSTDLNVKHALDEDKRRSILNILIGTTKAGNSEQ